MVALPVQVKLLDARLTGWGFPRRGSEMSAGLDLFACLDGPLDLRPGDAPTLISSGLAIRIGDAGWCGIIAPRSGLGHRGLVLGNSIGIIDADYEGPCLISAWNRNPPGAGQAITIAPGDRIAQLLFVPVGHPNFRVVPEFATPSARGAGGFGSSGLSGCGPGEPT